MVKSIQIQRAELSQENRRIRFRLWMTRGSTSVLRDIILQAERTGDVLELSDPESHALLGLVRVASQTASPLAKTSFEEWIVHLQPEDKTALETMVTLPEIHPDPY